MLKAAGLLFALLLTAAWVYAAWRYYYRAPEYFNPEWSAGHGAALITLGLVLLGVWFEVILLLLGG